MLIILENALKISHESNAKYYNISNLTMKLKRYKLRNFRRLENITVEVEDGETIFVGPNNSGKTSGTSAFKYFVNQSPRLAIYDFSAPHTKVIDYFGKTGKIDKDFPSIEMDLWFSVNLETEYGRIADLLTTTSIEYKEIGIKISLQVKDIEDLREDYLASYSMSENSENQKSLTQFCSSTSNFNKHFQLCYFSLEKSLSDGDEKATQLKSKEGGRIINSLLMVDYVDAQRNIDDREIGRSNKLSTAFTDFYKNNLEEPDRKKEANKVIDKNNKELTDHYKEHFSSLIKMIQSLGVPSANDRSLKLLSTLDSESILAGNVSLHYIDTDNNHELPEAYNGLGFKNLIYMAIQVRHFHLQWMNTKENRPLCHLILIEEPEVHLHVQVQQTFVDKIWEIVKEFAKNSGEKDSIPQIIITTHSSHVVHQVDFEKIRYFRRCASGIDESEVKKASEVLSLRNFHNKENQKGGNEKENLIFLKKYLKLIHCDLFFADASILIEGTSEKLLMPQMIDKSAPELKSKYITTLEIGGAYAHKLSSLLDFIHIPYLVITDLDSVDPNNKRKKCIASHKGAITSNETIKFYLKGKEKIADLVEFSKNNREIENKYLISYQLPVSTKDGIMIPRTFEESIICENLDVYKDDENINLIKDNCTQSHENIYKYVNEYGIKKVEFALNLMEKDDWKVPEYISKGLVWLKEKTM
jgi:predicted ATP-dependent endonuclease of OLD family